MYRRETPIYHLQEDIYFRVIGQIRRRVLPALFIVTPSLKCT
jgi:hypothetical protein